MTARVPPPHRRRKGRWDKALPAPRITFPKPTDEEGPRCDTCTHRGELHEGWFSGEGRACCYVSIGGADRCGCKKFEA